MSTTSARIDARVRDLFERTIDLRTRERRELLERECAGDPALVRAVEDLVSASHAAPQFLERAAVDVELEGCRAGPWRIESLLSSGGMGDVYLASRADSGSAWRVALKVLRPGARTAQILERFAVERANLAALRHPYIVTLIDAGALDDGRPFLAMEYVEGEPIDVACARGGLDFAQRIELFVRVCEAVQHAHERLIVHCDLKPSNILIAEGGVPKLLDFGIARLLEPPRGDTSAAIAPATLGYASPEQLEGGSIGAASDVFSLGVLLFELVTNRRPFDLEGLDRDALRASYAREPAPAPSASVTNTALPEGRAGLAQPARALARRMRGDFDAIVRTALSIDPAGRYGSVTELALDLRRFLAGHPVAARPVVAAGRALRFLRRHRAASTFAGVALLALVAASVVSYRAMLRQRDEARIGWSAHAQAVTAARWIEELVLAARPAARESAEEFTRALDAASERLERETALQPEAHGRLHIALGALYLDSGGLDAAQDHLQRALDIATSQRGFGRADRERIEALLERVKSGR